MFLSYGASWLCKASLPLWFLSITLSFLWICILVSVFQIWGFIKLMSLTMLSNWIRRMLAEWCERVGCVHGFPWTWRGMRAALWLGEAAMPRITSNWPSSSLVQPLSLTSDLPGLLKAVFSFFLMSWGWLWVLTIAMLISWLYFLKWNFSRKLSYNLWLH